MSGSERRIVRLALNECMLHLASRFRRGAWTGEDAAEYILTGSGITQEEAKALGYTDLDDLLPNRIYS